jgi:hypothetical protein
MSRYKVLYSVHGGEVKHQFVIATTERAARSKVADMTPNFVSTLRVTK